MSWFRVHNDLVDDPKVQRLSDKNFRGLINTWCLASKADGIIPEVGELAFRLRMSVKKAEQLIADLTVANLIDRVDRGLTPHNWSGRQFKSDTSTERVKRYRERKRNGECNVTGNSNETGPDTEADTDAEIPDSSSLRSEESGVVPTDVGTNANADGKGAKRSKRNSYPADFEAFWTDYPTDANMSKVEAFGFWKKIDEEERKLAIKSLPAFKDYCKQHPDYRPVHACRYLATKRFEGHAAAAQAPSSSSNVTRSFSITPVSPSWSVWLSYYRDTPRKAGMARIMNECTDKGAPFFVPTEWPPGYQQRAA